MSQNLNTLLLIRRCIIPLILAWHLTAHGVAVDLNPDTLLIQNLNPFESNLNYIVQTEGTNNRKTIDQLSSKERYLIMLSALQSGEISGAIALANELRNEYKDDLHIVAIKVISEVENGNLASANQRLKNLTAQDKYEEASILLAKAFLAIAQKAYLEANQHLSTLILLMPKHGYAYVLQSHLASLSGDKKSARIAIEKALEYYPKMRIALNNAGYQALVQNDYTLALNYFTLLLANEGGCTARNGSAKALIGLNQFDNAIDTLKPCLGAPVNTESVLLTSSSLVELKKYDQAWSAIQTSINRQNQNDLSLQAAKISLLRGDIQNALKYSTGNDLDKLFINSLSKLVSGKFAQAETQFNTILNQNQKADIAKVGLATARLLQGNGNLIVLATIPKDSAFFPISSLLRALTPSLGQEKASLYFYQAKGISTHLSFDNISKTRVGDLIDKADKKALILGCLFQLLDYSTLSKKYFKQASKIKQDFLSAYLLAALQNQDNNFNAAETLILQALEAMPSSFSAQYLLADILMKQGKLKQSLTAFENALKLEPDAFAALKAGAISERLQDFARSEHFYRQAVKILPENYATNNQLAWFLASQNKNLDEGVTLAKKALQLSPGSSNVLDTLGWLYYKKGSFKLAQETLKQALGTSPSHSVLYHLGIVELELNNNNEAIALFEKITKSSQASKYSKQAQSELEKLLGN